MGLNNNLKKNIENYYVFQIFFMVSVLWSKRMFYANYQKKSFLSCL